MSRWRTLALAVYCGAAIVTFGHAAAERQRSDRTEYLECKADRRNQICFRENWGSFSGIAAAPLWPLYWSWEAFEGDDRHG